jgi:hypothetical protein
VKIAKHSRKISFYVTKKVSKRDCVLVRVCTGMYGTLYLGRTGARTVERRQSNAFTFLNLSNIQEFGVKIAKNSPKILITQVSHNS